ncbi:MAG: RNA-binding protein [Acidimicrobiia bacterium]|nr:RNA-binding protein [Acidimicrobiia bacterium]
MTRWLIDGNNVMGSRPDGWWNDREGAMIRLAQQIAEWCWSHDDEVVLVFDGREQASVTELAGGNLSIRFSGRTGRDAADDVVAALASPGDRVVTADRGLRRRLPAAAAVVGPRAFLDQLGR